MVQMCLGNHMTNHMVLVTPAQDPQKASSRARPRAQHSNRFSQPAALMWTGTGSRAAVASLACLQSLRVQLCDDHTPKHLERDSKSLLLMEGTEACGSCTGPEVFELPARAGPRPRKSVTKSVSGRLCADVPQVALRHFRKLVLTALLLHPPLHHPPTCSGQWLSPGWRPRLQDSILTV